MKRKSNTRLSALLIPVVLLGVTSSRAADISWTGGTGTYNNSASWAGGIIPGATDAAINDSGIGNVVQINIGDPDWFVSQLMAGNSSGNGAFVQNGQTLSVTNSTRSFRLGVSSGRSGAYTLNGGTLNYGGQLSVGELGTGSLTVAGGLIAGSGNFAVNAGNAPIAVNATIDGGTNKTGHTWFERGFYTGDVNRGLPVAGSTITHEAFTDHSYTMPSSYAVNNAFLVGEGSPVTITLTPKTAASTLSFLGSASDGPVTNTYVIHFDGAPDETGELVVPDWYNNDSPIALRVGGRVQANGMNFQNVGGEVEFPRLFGIDIPLVNTTSDITSIEITHVSGGRAGIFAVSGFSGAAYTPLAVTGYNADIVLESGAPVYVSSSVTDTLTQTGGQINITGEFWLGNVGNGVYNLSEGTNFFRNWSAIGRSSGKGTLTMTGGELNKQEGGNLIIGTAYQALPGVSTVGLLNQSGGVINCQNEYWLAEGGSAIATNNISGTAVLNIGFWASIGRGGLAAMTLSGGNINKTGGGQFIVADNGTAYYKQTGGALNVNNQIWIGQWHDGVGQFDLSSGTVTNNSWLAVGREGADGVLNITGGSMTKQGDGNISIAHGHNDNGTMYGASGTVNQSGGVFTCVSGETWIGEDNGPGIWNMSGGVATLNYVQLARDASASGTLNLNGGTMSLNGITGGGGTSTLNLNGATLIARVNNENFINGLGQANVGNGGVTIDTAGFNVAIGQSLLNNGTGGLIKNGAGTLTLNGANSYAGATVVNAGKLATTTASTGGGDYTLANNTALDLKVISANSQLTAQNATLASSGPITMNFDLGSWNPTVAPLGVISTLAVNGAVTVNIAASAPAAGTFPLIQYGSRVGSGSFILGSLPPGVAATIATNGSTIALVISSAGAPRWDGQVSGVPNSTWDIGSTANWFDAGTLAPVTYQNGKPTLFDDNAAGTTTVNLTATVAPGSLTVDNSNLPYTWVGTGKVSGTTGLAKQGTGVLAVHNTGGNNYTGATVISGGVLTVTNLANGGLPSPIGASSANPTNLTIGGGAFSYAGAPVAVDRGYLLTSTNSTIDVQTSVGFGGQVVAAGVSRLSKTGPGVLSYVGTSSNLLSGAGNNTANPGLGVKQGTVKFDGTAGAQTNRVQYDVWVGGTPDFGGHLELTNSTLLIDAWLAVGRGNGTVGNTSSLTLENSVVSANGISFGYWNNIPGNLAFQNITLRGNSVLTNRGGNTFNIAESGGSAATVDISGNSVLGSGPRIEIGGGGGTGVVTIANSGRLHTGGYIAIGNGGTAKGTLIAKDNATVYVATDFNISDTGSGNGTMTLQDNAWASGGSVWVGKIDTTSGTLNMSGNATLHSRGNLRVADGANSTGTINMSGGTVRIAGELWMGEDGKGYWNQTGGDVYSTNWIAIGRNNTANCEGIYTISGGSVSQLDVNDRFLVGSQSRGTLNVSGTASVYAAAGFQIAEVATVNSFGTVNLNGGTITARRVFGGGGTSVLNWNGGKIVAREGANPDFMTGITTAYVMSGGAVIDSGTNTINIAQPLLDGSGGGGLTKLGSGTVNLNGANTYTGATLVNAGSLGGSGSISGLVTVGAAGTLAPGTSIGTLTVNNDVSLGGQVLMEISKNGGVAASDLLTVSGNLAYGGKLTIVLTGTNGLAINDTFNLFDWGTRNGSFAQIVLPAGYLFDTSNLNVNGTVRVVGVSPPQGNPPMVVGGNMILTGIGGPAGASYTWLTSTDIEAPISSWTVYTVGVFDSAGGYSNAIPVNASEPARFFRLKTP